MLESSSNANQDWQIPYSLYLLGNYSCQPRVKTLEIPNRGMLAIAQMLIHIFAQVTFYLRCRRFFLNTLRSGKR